MDETQRSRTLDAAATRKRRSSILKNQRAPRTPFSELEFNVATPTDTAKSRRVSFSRRTGVAEFVTNEATTTWKNFYEEQNKSLESSGNDSEDIAPRQSIGHIGKRIFDQQFEEVEAVDFIRNLNNPTVLNINTSINVNFTEQIASLECMGDDRKLTAPLSNFELSTFTDQQSKVFGDELTIPSMCEMSGGINVNFSAVQTIQGKDDLDEMERDLERAQSNVCHGPFVNNGNMSDYIEIDLNTTQVNVRNEDSDMSITDTINSPKVQEVSKNFHIDKKLSLSNDWMADKENIAINPYAAPRESANFAINQESDKVLVFDGKRLTLQSEKDDTKNYRQTLIPNTLVEEVPTRKTIVLNVNDDLPNFVDDLQVSKTEISKCQEQKRKTVFFHDNMGNVSMTQGGVSNKIIPVESDICDLGKTVVYGNDTGNISITQAISANILHKQKSQKRRTILYEADTADISVTQAVSSNVMLLEQLDVNSEKKNTFNLVFEANNCDISLTQALPSNIITDKVLEKRKTILYENDTGDISMTQMLSGNIIQEAAERKIIVDDNGSEKGLHSSRTVVYGNNFGDLSVTEAISSVILSQQDVLPQHRKTILYEKDTENISATQAIPSNIILSEQKIIDIAICDSTRVHSKNMYESERTNTPDRIRTVVYEKDFNNFAVPPAKRNVEEDNFTYVKQDKRKTIVYENNDGDISITSGLPTNVILDVNSEIVSNKRQTIVFDDNCDISMTEALPYNLVLETGGIKNNLNTFVHQDMIHDKMKTEVPEMKQKAILYEELGSEKVVNGIKRRTIVFKDDADMSITQPIVQLPITETEKQNISVFQSDLSTLSMTKHIPAQLITLQTEHGYKSMKEQGNVFCEEIIPMPTRQDVLVYQADTHSHSTSKLQSKKADQGDLKSGKTMDSKCSSKNQVMASTSKLIDNDAIEMKTSQICIDDDQNQIIILSNKELNEKESLDKPFANILTSECDSKIANKEDKNITNEPNESILDDLLDMTAASIDVLDDKNVMVEVQSEQVLDNNEGIRDNAKESNESMFYITKDSDEEVQTEKVEVLSSKDEIESNNTRTSYETPELKNKSPLSLEYIEENPGIINNLQNKLGELKSILQYKKSPPKNRHYEKIISSDIESEAVNTEKYSKESKNISNVRKSIKTADDTNDLLQLLSEFTDNKVSDHIEEDEIKPEPIVVKGHVALENKSGINDNRRLSFIPRRHSIVISREDLLNNISMAHAALQKSRCDLDDSENSEETEIESPDLKSPLKKTVRMSNEVVKTLHFDEDETESDTSVKSDKISPLKKTAFGETSYMNESKAKVIPSYIKDVPNEIKELMHDLVKPTADIIPFENSDLDKNLKNTPSTCSTQIQANLTTSSQIDVHTELYSNPASTYAIDKQTLVDEVAALGNQVMSHTLKSPIKPVARVSEKSLVNEFTFKQNVYKKSTIKDQTFPGKVLVFDNSNPLNNVLLAPLNHYEAHKYNPIKSDETLCGSERSDSVQISINEKEKAFEVERVSLQYNMESRVTLTRLVQQSGDACFEKNADAQSIMSNLSKPVSMDQSIDAKVTEVKDIDVNTLIVMKGNKELLEASSSLTLVDDAPARSTFDVDIDSKASTSKDEILNKAKSPLKVIYKTERHEYMIPKKIDSDIISIDDESGWLQKHSKPRKRIYSPTKRDKHRLSPSNLDITPKPMSKMQKTSISPTVRTCAEIHQNSPEHVKLITEHNEKSDIETKTESKDESIRIDALHENKKKALSKSKSNRTDTSLTVQQLITAYKVEQNNIEENKLKKEILEAFNEPRSDTSSVEPKTVPHSDVEEAKSLEVVSSFTSSKNMNEAREDRSISLDSQQMSGSSVRSKGCINWHPELVNELSSKNLVTECESSANVVAKIDMLPFMGSHECEWETSSGDMWSFRLLHSRVRLTVCLGHRHDNASRTHVRADTPVRSLAVEIAHQDKKNSVASVCVGFGAEAMRYLCGRGCERAGEVPTLVRRCGAVARVALRWGRAMHDARLRLAYNITEDGLFALKVANIPLRSVWEVTMRLELVVDDAREAPWPRASDVRVTRVLSDVRVSDEEVRRAVAHVPRDWGHVPRTVWRIFKHLKNKMREDELLGI